MFLFLIHSRDLCRKRKTYDYSICIGPASGICRQPGVRGKGRHHAGRGYPGGALNSAFQVDLDAFIESAHIDYWIFGHTHFAGGSGSRIGETTLLCNQLGYVFSNEHSAFNRHAFIDL